MASPYTYFKKISVSVVFLCLSTSACGSEMKDAGPRLPTKEIILSGQTITVEVADQDNERSRGLMFREYLQHDHGMLFIFEQEMPLSFWMKNTFIDLSIGFFDKNRTLVDIQEMKKTSMTSTEIPSYVSKKPALYALEMNRGWFAKNKVKVGSRFEYKVTPKSRARN
jgi:uncharacterized protein